MEGSGPARFAFLEHDGPIAFAHRGGAAGALENSFEAFARAVELGYRYLETDVRATSDGVLLAFHDRILDRVTDRSGTVSQLPFAEVRRARISGTAPIPQVADLLEAWPDVRLNIDVKDEAALGPLVELVRRAGVLDRVCVASFSPRRLSAVRRALGPSLCTSLSPLGVARLRLAAGLPPVARLGPALAPCAQVPVRARGVTLVTPGFVRTAHRWGVRVHVWVVDEPAEMNRLLELGVDGVMTDDLVALRDVMAARGRWPPP
ncbi:MAG: glycerophosphoryl diester phosphodiesterase [Actinomycetota bacterium]|jgi:glycerophosphoryl diester phosphodiesterase|nr:glycerophosphoryl diester phosphodiesterase [Actinomycetota bacterium]